MKVKCKAMGMYTGFQIDVKLKKDLPEDVIEIFKVLAGQVEMAAGTGDLPKDPFFFNSRWSMILTCQSSYFEEYKNEQLEPAKRFVKEGDGSFRLKTLSSLKNYDDTITQFLNWISPYVDPSVHGQVVGSFRYEEYENDTTFYFSGKGPIEVPPPREIRRGGPWGY